MLGRTILAATVLGCAFPVAASPPSLEQRVERMEDESTIRKMLIDYGAYLDGRDYAAYAALFADDGIWTGGFGSFTGPAAIEKMLTDNLGPPEPGFVNKSSFHMLTNPLIEIDGNRARVESKYMFWTRSSDDKPTPMLAGRYVDDFVKVKGQWKIAHRTTWGAIPFRDPSAPRATSGPPIATAGPSMEQRLRRAEDTLEIEGVINEYAARLDARDFDGYAALFSRDGTWQTGTTVRHGPAEIKAMLSGLFGPTPPGFVNASDYHLVSNIDVDVDGDRATARSRHLMMTRGKDGHPSPTLAGYYDDEFVREDGRWKILHRIDHPLMPTAEEWAKEMAARRPK